MILNYTEGCVLFVLNDIMIKNSLFLSLRSMEIRRDVAIYAFI